jgi:hypothetical protein
MKIQEFKNIITKEEEEVVVVVVEEVIIIVLLTERFFALNFLASHNLERKRRRGSTRRFQSRQSLWYCADEGRCRDGAQGSRHDLLLVSLCACVRCVCLRSRTVHSRLFSSLSPAFFGRAAVEVSKAIF